jgi:hypothetical protein
LILLSFPVVDEISSTDPVTLVLEYEHGSCWLEVLRLGVRLMSRGSIVWDDGQWCRRGTNPEPKDTNMYELTNEPMSSEEVADLIFRELLVEPSLAGQVPRSAIRAALDERRMSELSLALEVLES